MKRYIPTLALVIVCIAAFWYASSQSFFKKEEESASKPLLSISKDQIASVSLTNEKGNVELKNEGGSWSMVQPSKLPANSFSVDSFLTGFGSLTQDGVVDDNPSDLSKFGLQAPAQQMKAVLKDGSSRTLLIGSPLPIGGHVYAKLGDAPAVYKLSEMQLEGLNKGALDLMEKSPVLFTYNEVQSVSMNWKGTAKTVTKSDAAKTAIESAWKLGDKELTGNEATPLLDKLIALQTDQLVKPASEVKPEGGELKLEIKAAPSGKEPSATVYNGRIEGDIVWIAKQGDAWAYAIPLQSVQEAFDAVK